MSLAHVLPAFRFAPCGLRTVHASSFSRVTRPPSFANLPLTPSEGAERRQALGCSGTRRRASDVGPQAHGDAPCVPRGPFARSARRGRSPLGAPPRRFLGPEPALAKPSGAAMRGPLRPRIWPCGRPLVVGKAAFARGPREPGYEPVRRRSIPLRLRLVSGDALGERDERTICLDEHLSKIFGTVPSKTGDMLLVRETRKTN